MLSNPFNTAGKQTLIRACMPAAFCVDKVRQSFGGDSIQAVEILHQKNSMQGPYVLHIWSSTRVWYWYFWWEIWSSSEVNFWKGIYLELVNFSNKSLNKFFFLWTHFLRCIWKKKTWCTAGMLLCKHGHTCDRPEPWVLSEGGQLTEVLILVYMVACPLWLCATCEYACKVALTSQVGFWK